MSEVKSETQIQNNHGKKRKKKKRQSNIASAIFKLIAFIYVVITIIFYSSILKMELLPAMYVTIFTIAEIIFTLTMIMGIVKTHRTYKLNIFCIIIAILISGVYIYATNYALATTDFLGNLFTEVAETEEYYIVVKKDTDYSTIEDIVGEKVYLFKAEEDVKNEITNKVNIEYEVQDNLKTLGEDLINDDKTVILISSAQYDILNEEIENFKSNTKIIYTAHHQIKVNESSEPIAHNGIFNVYISGVDTAGDISNVARSDANIIATINTHTHEVLLTSVPRDYYVTLHSYGAKDKLTHSGIYGINETVSTVEDLLDIDIHYYVRVNFTTVTKLVDTLDGINVYSDYDFTSAHDKYTFKKGYNHIYGDAALAFSRERYSFSEGDNQRVKNQQHVIEAIMDKVLSSNTILTKYTDILNSLEGCLQTNLEQEEIRKLVKNQLNNMSSWTVTSNSLSGTDSYNTTYSAGSTELYVMIPNQSSISAARDKIEALMEKGIGIAN